MSTPQALQNPHEDSGDAPLETTRCPDSKSTPTDGSTPSPTSPLSLQHKERTNEREEREALELHRLFRRNVVRNSFFLWFLGFINNFHYCLVMAGASDLAAGYGLKNLVALITWANVFFGIVSRVINMFLATHVGYNVRITAMALTTLLGLFFVGFSSSMGRHNNGASFAVMLIGVILSGAASNYGEAVVLTFVQRYPANLVGAWSSGTGISGVAASLIFIGLTSAGLTQQQTFLVSTPLVLVYWLCFVLGLVAPQRVLTVTYTNGKTGKHVIRCLQGEVPEYVERKRNELLSKDNVASVSEDYHIEMLMNIRGLGVARLSQIPRQGEEEEAEDTACCGRGNVFRRWWRDNAGHLKLMHNSMWWFFMNLAIVYIAEYAAQLMAPFSFYCKPEWKDNFWIKNSYVISQFCYQFGVLISRSSLLLVKIKFVGLLSLLQIANAVCWIIQTKVMFVKSTDKHRQVGLSFVLFAWMVFIGLLGGASYVNVFYFILVRSNRMQREEERAATQAYLEDAGLPLTLSAVMEDETKKETSCEDELQMIRQLFRRKVTASPEGSQEHNQDQSPEPALSDDNEADTEMCPRQNSSGSERVGITTPEKTAIGTVNGCPCPDATEETIPEEVLQELHRIRQQLSDVWYVRREMGMNIGAMYATFGITLGNVVDLILTNTMLKNSESC